MTRILALLGPTASGKTEVAIHLAHHYDAEIISVDSMQVYRHMDIGTAKPNVLERQGIRHHMIDIIEPENEFSVAEFRRLGRRLIDESTAPTLLVTGGSGLHFRALVDPLSFAPTDAEVRSSLEEMEHGKLVEELLACDGSAALHVDLANPRRVIRAVEIYRLTGETPSRRAAAAKAEDVRRYVPEIPFEAVGVDPGSDLEKRVAARVQAMRAGGLVEEVSALWDRMGRTARSAVGYREIGDALNHGGGIEGAISRIVTNTKKLARRQRTWFQRDPRIKWIPWSDDPRERVSRVIEVFE